MQKLTALKYARHRLVPVVNIFDTENVISEISFDEEYNEITVTELFGDLSTDNSELTPFYPAREPEIYRVLPEREITVPAGTFECTVVEAAEFSNNAKIRYYMINSRPGVFAKIVVIQKPFEEEEYESYELTAIEGNFTERNYKEILGEWLLIQTTANGKSTPASIEFEFINDGRVMIKNGMQISSSEWNYDKNNATLEMISEGSVKYYHIDKLGKNTMLLSENNLQLEFIRFNAELMQKNNPKANIAGYWLLTEEPSKYGVVYFTGDGTFSFADRMENYPPANNYFTVWGKWLYKPASSTLIFNAHDGHSLFTGAYSLNENHKSKLILKTGKNSVTLIKLKPKTFTKNNKRSGLEGLWKITNGNGSISYYKFEASYKFSYSNNGPENLYQAGIWFYNPENKKLFIGAMIHQSEGFSKIEKIGKNSVKFKSGIKAERVR